MNLSEKHPLYGELWEDWALMRHTHAGERRVKEEGTLYLPATSGMVANGIKAGQSGYNAYIAYVQRAVFHEFVSTAVRTMVGIMHRKDPVIELPSKLQPLINSATIFGEPLKTLLRRVNMEQLITGRVGVLLDLPFEAGPSALPYLATYTAESIVNWDTRVGPDGRKSFDFIALDETGPQRRPTALSWNNVTQFRMLTTGEFLRLLGFPAENVGDQDYVVAVVTNGSDLGGARTMRPEVAGRPLSSIPFVTIGALDLDPSPDQPPFLPLARKAIASYRLEADYRHQLFMQAQETLVIIGQGRAEGEPPPQIGAGAILYLDAQADAKYVGVSAAGLAEMRQAVDAEKQAAAELGAQILDTLSTGSAASGDALAVRVAARTVTLASIARAGADGLVRLLRMAAEWVGANPDEVVIQPNLDFGDERFTADDLLKLMQAKAQGAPLSNRTIHQLMEAGEFTQLSYEDELDEIDTEADATGMPAGARAISPDQIAGGNPPTGAGNVPTDEDEEVASGSDVTGDTLSTSPR